MIRRDYIERLIEECAEALRRMLGLRRAGRPDEALRVFSDAVDRVLGPMRPLLEQLDARSAVQAFGWSELDRIRLYAALMSEEALLHEGRGDSARAYMRSRRALELFAAVSSAGGRLDATDLQRIATLRTTVDVEELDPPYSDELRRLSSG